MSNRTRKAQARPISLDVFVTRNQPPIPDSKYPKQVYRTVRWKVIENGVGEIYPAERPKIAQFPSVPDYAFPGTV